MVRQAPVVAAGDVAGVLVGPRAVRSRILEVLDRPGPAVVEAWELSSSSVVDALAGRALAGQQVDVLAGQQLLESGGTQAARLQLLRDAGVQVHSYGGGRAPAWQHAKVVSVGGESPAALVTNLPLSKRGKKMTEVAVEVRGDTARAISAASRAAIDGGPAAIRDAAAGARHAGVLVNDPIGGVHHLSDALDGLLAAPGRDLLVAVKELNHPPFARRLVHATRAAERSRVVVRDLAPVDAAILHAAGVPVEVVRGQRPRMRVNVIAADDRAYLGSGFPWTAMVHRGQGSTRDMGVLLDGGAAHQVRQVALGIVNGYREGAGHAAARGLQRHA